MFVDTSPLGFLTTVRAQNVDHIIGKTEKLVERLDLSPADLAPAQEALSAAKALFAAHDYTEAAAQAKRAGALAVSLNERFNGYMDAWTALQDCLKELQELGFPTVDLEAALGAAEKEMARPVAEDGSVVPNYLGARALLERATEEARALLVRARDASREIFLATLAVEALTEPQPLHTPTWLGVRLEEIIEQATRELALGKVSEASRLASEARCRAEAARLGDTRDRERLEDAAAELERLGAQGSVADEFGRRIASTREAIANGFLDSTTERAVVGRLADHVRSFTDGYTRARRLLLYAEQVRARLQEEGFRSDDVDRSLSDAGQALGDGEWAAMREHVSRASREFVRWRKQRAALAKAITDIHERVTLLEDFRLPLLPDVQEILGRAEEEFRTGRLAGATEDVLYATALMMEATRSGS